MSVRTTALLPLLLAVLAAAVVPGCSQNPVTGERQLSLIPRQQEVAMGEEAAPQFKEEFGGEVTDPQVQNYVRSVGQRVARVAARDLPYEFTAVRDDTPNAFALPGGKIFITAGLLNRLTNEQQLAAVLAHEVAHADIGHNVQALQRQMGVEVLAQAAGAVIGGTAGEAAAAATKVVGGMRTLSYSRDAEYEADRYGMIYMERAGYNPWGMVELLTVLYNLSQQQGGRLTEMFQTHPLTSNRIERAETQAREDFPRYSRDAASPQAPRAPQTPQSPTGTL